MRCLIDGDILVYRAGFATQKTEYRFVYNDGSETGFGDLTQLKSIAWLKEQGFTMEDGKLQKLIRVEPVAFACHTVKNMINEMMADIDADAHQVYLTSTDKSNYRFDIAKTKVYKGNRKAAKPVHYDAIRDYLTKYWNAAIITGMEADDAMGIEQYTNGRGFGCDAVTIICTIDKDLDMIPGWHYNFVTKELYETDDPGTLELSENRRKLKGGGLLWFYAQILLGDSADNIPGLPGFGPVKVYDVLYDCKDEREMVRNVYSQYTKQMPKLDAIERLKEVADLLWILRKPDERKSEHIEEMLR